MESFSMIAKCFKGFEAILARELTDLGAQEVRIGNRAVNFTGDKRLLYKANLHLRTALCVLKPIATFKAQDTNAVYENVKKIDWQQFMTLQNSFTIDVTVHGDAFTHSQFVVYRVKDGIVDYWKEKTNTRPNVSLTAPDIFIHLHISGNKATLCLDSSGEKLFKRGYRDATTEAPLNEVLAAGLLLTAGWNGQCDFYDMMCGSATIPIEAALIAQNIPPNIYREHFAFEKWQDFDAEMWQEIYNDDTQERPFEYHIYASDASFYAINVAKKNIARAGLQNCITAKQIRLEEVQTSTQDKAFIMINPPYGERLNKYDVAELYKSIGDALKKHFLGATAWILSANDAALKKVGLKASKRIRVLNGDLDCLFNQYELFAGKHKDYKRDLVQQRHRNAKK